MLKESETVEFKKSTSEIKEAVISIEMVSERRNELIADLFHRINFIEKWGRGISLILSRQPDARFKEIGTHFIVTFRRKGLAAESVETSRKAVEKTVEKIYELIKSDPHITQNKLMEETGLSRRGVEWNLRKLKEEGRIKRIGPDKGGHWIHDSSP